MYECIRMEGSIAVGYQASSPFVKISLLVVLVLKKERKTTFFSASPTKYIPSEFEAVFCYLIIM